jgi:hypothetical protein
MAGHGASLRKTGTKAADGHIAHHAAMDLPRRREIRGHRKVLGA